MIALALVSLLLLIPGVAAADPYFNSSEPGCGTDPNVLMCDDFESSDALHLPPAGPGPGVGTWASENADVASSNGGIDVRTKGWAMRIRNGYPHSICGSGVGAGGSNCAARSILKGGNGGDSALADHSLAPGTGPGRGSSYNEYYVRFYFKPLSGYVANANQKFISLNPCCANDGGIVFGGFGRDMRNPQLCPTQSCSVLNEGYLQQNQGANFQPLGAAINHWQFWEIHVKLNTPGQRDGVFQWWANDCGAAGTQCTGTPTLRMRHTNVFYRPSGETRLLGALFFDIWGNPADVGTMLIDQIKVTKTGPIGFMGAAGTTPPPVTTTFTLTTATTGAGAVSGAGSYPSGTIVTPVALPASGSTFSGWSGDCTGSGACTVTMTADKSVTATFTTPTTPPPTTSVPPMPSSPMVSLGTQDATGPTFNVSWPAVSGATSYSFTAGLSDGSNHQAGTVTPPNMLLKTPYMANGAAGTGYVCIKGVNAAGSSAEAACNGLTVPAKPAVIPPPLTTGTLTVEASITRCNYFLTAEPPDASGGWVAQFYRDGSTKVGNPITAAPYKRSVELYAPSHSFSVQFTKTGSVMRSPAVVTRACP